MVMKARSKRDPDIALSELREVLEELAEEIDHKQPQDLLDEVEPLPELVSEAIDLFQGLDDWLSNGGFKPKDWA